MAASKRQTEMILRELMQDRSGEVVDAALAARKAILKSAGECSDIIYETYCISNAFSFTGKQGQGFIHIATYANHVNIGFDRGTELEDPEGLLKGTGKLIRHIRLNTVSDVKQDAIIRLIEAAVEQGRAMAEKKGGALPTREAFSAKFLKDHDDARKVVHCALLHTNSIVGTTRMPSVLSPQGTIGSSRLTPIAGHRVLWLVREWRWIGLETVHVLLSRYNAVQPKQGSN